MNKAMWGRTLSENGRRSKFRMLKQGCIVYEQILGRFTLIASGSATVKWKREGGLTKEIQDPETSENSGEFNSEDGDNSGRRECAEKIPEIMPFREAKYRCALAGALWPARSNLDPARQL